MPRYSIAFHSPAGKFLHQIVELDSREASLQFFFKNFVDDGYTNDAEGYNYFQEDFNDPDDPLGSILEIP